jgi:hypothetical protein
MENDVALKRGKFIGKIHSLNQDLHFYSPHLLIKLYNIYCCSFYGSNLYDLFSAELEKFYSSWNIAVKIVFKLPHLTSQKVKSSMRYAPVPEDEEWRVSLIRELLAASLENEVDVPLSSQEIEDILNYACI